MRPAAASPYAEAFPATQVVCLDELRARVADDPGDQGATGDAVAVQNLLLDARPTSSRTRADELDQLAERLPPPVGGRLRTNAHRLRATADTHDSTAQTAEALR